MRKIIYVFALALLTAGAYAQTHEVHVELGQAWGGGSSVDINNDGYLDFFITGNKNNPKPTPESERWNRMFFYNPATEEYDSVGTNLLMTERANLDWADIDGDGLVDLLAAEHSFDNYHAGVYKNLGTGQFELLDWPIPSRTVAAAFADFNNDGWMDYVCVSQDSAMSAVMINNGDNTFETTNVDNFGGFRFGLGYVEVLDYNNDGFMDFFVNGNVDNSYYLEGARVFADIFINYDEEPGNFYRANLGKTESNPDGVMFMKANGGVDFADFNSDGWIDFMLNGEGGAGTGEPTEEPIWACATRIYLNTQDGSFAEKVQTVFEPDLRPLASSGVGTGTIDWNYDGHYDLVMTGWNPLPDGADTQAGYLYYGDGAGNFTDQGRIPGGSETVLLFLDWNADNILDYLVSGHCWDAMWYTAEQVGRTASVYFNTNTSSPNVKPSAPTNLAATVDGNNVELTWDAATDDKTPAAALAYEYFLKDGDGNFVVAPASFVGGDHDGLRKILKLGNAYLNKFVKLHNLPDGNYTWGVQALDASYEGSAFATGTFKIGGVSVKNVKTTSLADIYSYDNNLIVRIKSSRNADVAIYNMIGQSIVSKVISGEFATELPTGVYLVKVASEGNVQVKKVFIK